MAKDQSIDGIIFEERAVLGDHRGAVMHYLKAGSHFLPMFGEVYMSTVMQGMVKAWKRHHRVAQNIVVPIGSIRFVAFDSRPNSPTHGVVLERMMGRKAHGVLHIPPGIWYGFRGEAPNESLIVNCICEAHDPTECDRLPEDSDYVPYAWSSYEF